MKQAMMSVPPEIEAKRTSALMSLGRPFMATYLATVLNSDNDYERFDISMFDHFKILDGEHMSEGGCHRLTSSASASIKREDQIHL